MEDCVLLRILSTPPDPPINTHDGIIKIYACLANQSLPEAQVDIKDGINKPNRINKDILLPAKPDTDNARKNSDVFNRAGGLHPFYKGLQNLFCCH